jgi:hypothetical protein
MLLRPPMASAFILLCLSLGCTPGDIQLTDPTSSDVASVVVTVSSPSLSVGQSSTATATIIDQSGNILDKQPDEWTSSDPSVLTITEGGVLSAVATGHVTITAKSKGHQGDATVDVTLPVPPPAGGWHVPLTIQRFDGSTGTVLVSNAIPLPPGRLNPGDASKVQLYVGGTEQSIHAEELEGRHPDGSLRSLLVQFYAPVPAATALDGEMIIGEARRTTDIARPAAGRSLPAAVALPTDVDYLISTNIVGKSLKVSETAQLGTVFARYDQDFKTFSDLNWAAQGDNWTQNFYDRALAYYAQWMRSGNVEYWRRATRFAVSYRVNYLEASNYGTSPHWSQLEGLEAHYLLTGDDSSRAAIEGATKTLTGGFLSQMAAMDNPWMDDRIRARMMMSLLTSWRVNAGGNRAMYAAQLDSILPTIINTQATDGADRFVQTCNGTLNYMAGQLNDAMIKYYTYYKPDSRIPGFVKRSVDYLWTSQWVPANEAFQYLSVACPNIGDPTPQADLNNLLVNGFAFTYARTRDVTYRDRADQIFSSAVRNGWLNGDKQFNQEYTSSYLYLALRQ